MYIYRERYIYCFKFASHNKIQTTICMYALHNTYVWGLGHFKLIPCVFSCSLFSTIIETLSVCTYHIHKADSRLAPSQWEMAFQSNAVPHWLGANLESALHPCMYDKSQKWRPHQVKWRVLFPVTDWPLHLINLERGVIALVKLLCLSTHHHWFS